MKTTIQKFKSQFSERLIKILKQKGYHANRKPYYIDIVRLAKEINCTVSVARRYISSTAIPPFAKIDQLGKLLEVDPLWLYCGTSDDTIKNFDSELLKNIILKLITTNPSKNTMQKLDSIIDFGFEIYKQIQSLENASEIEKQRLIKWMAENMLQENSLKASDQNHPQPISKK